MSWIAVGMGVAGLATGAIGAMSNNKKVKGLGLGKALPSFSGYKPPEFKNLRPVEQQVTDILMRRSQGQDVGFDPTRREKLLENYGIEAGRNWEDKRADILNQLSGTGLSRNLAARDEMMGRAEREKGREATLYRNRMDIEDLGAAREDKNINTQNLQNWGQFGFGQENRRADFDKDLYSASIGNELSRRAGSVQELGMQESVLGSALEGGAAGYGMGSGFGKLSGSSSAGSYGAPIETSEGSGVRQGKNDFFGGAKKRTGINIFRR